MTSEGHVLVVEGDHLLRVRLRMLLEGAGFEVSTAADGRMALELLQMLAGTPTLILVNPVMRLIEGAAFLRRVKERWSEIPLVLLSSDRGQLSPHASDEEILDTVRRLSHKRP